MAELDAWDSFYVIVGSAGGALIGLQFVVMTLIAERPPLRVAEAGSAFTTPGTVHFSIVLLVSALLRVPWSASCAAAACGLIGAGGAAYTFVIGRRMRRQNVYAPDFEDWLFHFVLPLIAYVALLTSAFAALSHTREALFGVGAGVLLLLFSGIHNTWDGVAFFVFSARKEGLTLTGRGRAPAQSGTIARAKAFSGRIPHPRTPMCKAALVATLTLALSATAAIAQSPAQSPAQSGPQNPAVKTDDANNSSMPVKGANSFTMSEAKSRISDKGYTNVSGLKKDANGVWRGMAKKDGQKVHVSVDYQGNVNTD